MDDLPVEIWGLIADHLTEWTDFKHLVIVEPSILEARFDRFMSGLSIRIDRFERCVDVCRWNFLNRQFQRVMLKLAEPPGARRGRVISSLVQLPASMGPYMFRYTPSDEVRAQIIPRILEVAIMGVEKFNVFAPYFSKFFEFGHVRDFFLQLLVSKSHDLKERLVCDMFPHVSHPAQRRCLRKMVASCVASGTASADMPAVVRRYGALFPVAEHRTMLQQIEAVVPSAVKRAVVTGA
jgi:hypothetical protein